MDQDISRIRHTQSLSPLSNVTSKKTKKRTTKKLSTPNTLKAELKQTKKNIASRLKVFLGGQSRIAGLLLTGVGVTAVISNPVGWIAAATMISVGLLATGLGHQSVKKGLANLEQAGLKDKIAKSYALPLIGAIPLAIKGASSTIKTTLTVTGRSILALRSPMKLASVVKHELTKPKRLISSGAALTTLSGALASSTLLKVGIFGLSAAALSNPIGWGVLGVVGLTGIGLVAKGRAKGKAQVQKGDISAPKEKHWVRNSVLKGVFGNIFILGINTLKNITDVLSQTAETIYQSGKQR